MRKAVLTFLALLVIGSLFVVRNNTSPESAILQLAKDGQIMAGELRYRINFINLIPVGEAFFQAMREDEYQGQKVYHLGAKAKSLAVYSRFFTAQADVDSYIDKVTLAPIFFKQRLSLKGKGDILKEVFYNQNEHIMSIGGIQRQILPDTQDPLSAIYRIKNIDFAKNKEFSFNVNTNQKNYILKGAGELKAVTINRKIYKLIFVKASIARRDKNPYHKSHISLVLLQEKENIPILMKVFASGILINIKLIEAR